MNISHIIHPELIMNLRGPEALRKAESNFVDAYDPERNTINISKLSNETLKIINPVALADSSTMTTLALFKRYKTEKFQNYYLPKSFCSALIKIEKELTANLLPEGFGGYFVLPKDYFKTNDGLTINGLYLEIFKKTGSSDPRIQICIIGDRGDRVGQNKIVFASPILEGQTITETILACMKEPGTEVNLKNYDLKLAIVNIAVNATLYIHHVSEDILNLKPSDCLSNSKRTLERAKGAGYLNLCTLPMKLVNFDYHTERLYSVESTLVRGYFRWQHHGPNKSMLKFIYVDQHERVYGRIKDVVTNVEPSV